MDKSEYIPISFSEAAIAKIKMLMQKDGDPNIKLRIYIVGGGCSGFQYGFALDAKELSEDDILIEKETVSKERVFIVIDAMSAQYLVDAQVDYRENLQGSQFVVHNPNAETTCGCGSSFSLKESE